VSSRRETVIAKHAGNRNDYSTVKAARGDGAHFAGGAVRGVDVQLIGVAAHVIVVMNQARASRSRRA